MNKRLFSLIDDLETSITTLAILAAKYKVSERTIRKDIIEVNELIKKYQTENIGMIHLDRGGKVVVPLKYSSDVLKNAFTGDYYSYRLSPQERADIAASIIINTNGFITLSVIADYLCVSRVTIINDLDIIRERLQEKQLTLISQPNKGLHVDGCEKNKREFLVKIGRVRPVFVRNNKINQTAGTESLESMLRQIVNGEEHTHQLFFSDRSFEKTIDCITVIVNRVYHGENIEINDFTHNEYYQLAKDILHYTSQYYHIDIAENEVIFLANFFQMQRFIRQKKRTIDSVKIQLLTRQFIEKISNELDINLNSDFEFLENLSNHLESTLSKPENGNEEITLLQEVYNRHANIVETVKNNIDIFNNYAGRYLTKIEMGYVIIHVCAAIERHCNSEKYFRVIVSCHAGIGTSKLLLEKLKEHFNFYVVAIVSAHDMKKINETQADFVISTIPLKDCLLPFVVVSPIITDEDYVRIGNQINKINISELKTSTFDGKQLSIQGIMEVIEPVLYETVPHEVSTIMKKIRKAIKYYIRQDELSEKESFMPELHHLLPYTHIVIDAECNSWQEAIQISSNILLKRNYITQEYINSMIKNISDFGPYIIVAPGLALPHSKPDFGSKKLGMQFTRLKNPISFGDEILEPVEFICTLSPVDSNTHLKAFFNLVNMLKTPSFKRAMHNANTSQEVADIILEYEYGLW
ncbi:BglG family transcription antiterminator [Pectinatus haikarae]|uniref:Transcriptional antiterminator/mannitol/fructose-specific phosphotransferase system IIA component (Ntr-type) n=1 Tax=Pectinatus haikarae TaxID=349096 RepID=A0ABT9YB65_9FIRM|nr:PTS sugar transporter subunit IIA [Pectinatus haikarae]MDQ0205084.1 transcriptional antiterminator/mannitol/fructose-specific phosphotransferase system IIA component (Ntr-type) [Pectinatus haikarae]